MAVALSWTLELAWVAIIGAALFFFVSRRTQNRRNAAVLAGSVVVAFLAGALLHPPSGRPDAGPAATAGIGGTEVAGAPPAAPVDERMWKDTLSDLSIETTAKVGGPVPGSLVIKNASPVTWSVRGNPAILGGFHWINDKGVAVSEGRFDLGSDFTPAAKRRVAFTAEAPLAAGNYHLQIDLLAETVDWFGNHGNQTATVAMKVVN